MAFARSLLTASFLPSSEPSTLDPFKAININLNIKVKKKQDRTTVEINFDGFYQESFSLGLGFIPAKYIFSEKWLYLLDESLHGTKEIPYEKVYIKI